MSLEPPAISWKSYFPTLSDTNLKWQKQGVTGLTWFLFGGISFQYRAPDSEPVRIQGLSW